MKVHHLNCGSMCPLGRRLLSGEGGWFAAAHMCCHCLLIEGKEGLILVDTGLGTADVANPNRLGMGFNAVVRPRLLMSETALNQIKELGLDPRDVRHIVPTHLDLDHAGALSDFPQAEVHVYAKELQAALTRPSLKEKSRYIPAQWAHGPKWAPHSADGERWMGFEAIRALPGTDEEVLLVPLTGHTQGHCGVAVRGDNGWLLHCGDAYFFRGEMDLDEPDCPIGLRVFQSLVQMDGASRVANQLRLRELKQQHGEEVTLFCAHDPVELARLDGLSRQRRNARAQFAA
ncbi:MAG: MBL fold metallo-hydrolase [Aquabacterium sp.]|uniref:MBL fold metallo-hydrolase n=1 Tax=Aquabacterium sp. TaxID=1872578 RepID=UPI001211BF14|nr:MBL fold metallo-hydrolase [Aquabacterium sp.]TAK93778.1 MAG: MBL fold metallo-hydrolase [Aquabacterium sp.]